MITVVLVIHVLLAIAMVAAVLLQRSEGGALGIGGDGGGLMTGRAAANLLTRTTAVLAAGFMVSSILLAVLFGAGADRGSILDEIPTEQPAAPAEPAGPAGPSAPLSE